MPEVYIDGQACEGTFSDGQTLDEMLTPIRVDTSGRNEAILSVSCDGIDVEAETLPAMLVQPIGSLGRIEVRTGHPAGMVSQALQDALEALESAESQRAQVVALFNEGRTGDAIIQLGECLRCWHEINQIITKSVAFLGCSIEKLPGCGGEFTSGLQVVRDRLLEIRDAVKNRDYVSLSDILEYEFEDVCRTWREVMQALVRSAAASDRASRPAER